MKKRIMSGMRPTGSLHLGNYFGALENWVRLQDEYECYFSIVDWHALTTGYEDTSNLENNTIEMAADWISGGIDPNRSTIFLQSGVKEIAELHLLLSMIVPITWLERNPTYKDQLNQLSSKNVNTYGFLGYPTLQTADILIQRAEVVPVGEDQLPHLEISREIARRFNFIYGETFPEPQHRMNQIKLLQGLDGRKMSKSYGNVISIADDPELVINKVRRMITDPEKIKKDDPGHPDICSVFAMHKIFNISEVSEVERDCKAGSIGCVACKRNLANKINEFMAPMHEKRIKLIENKDELKEIIHEGTKKAVAEACITMEIVRENMKMPRLWK